MNARASILLVLLVATACTRGDTVESAAPETGGSATRGPADGAMPLYVFVGSDGVTYVGGEPLLDDATIVARAESFHAKYPRAGADVRSTQAAIHGRTVRVLDLLGQAEISPIHISMVER